MGGGRYRALLIDESDAPIFEQAARPPMVRASCPYVLARAVLAKDPRNRAVDRSIIYPRPGRVSGDEPYGTVLLLTYAAR